MLKELYIENLAVIEESRVSFCEGFNVFTGETGAGKSILVGGIRAILGGRVSKDIVRAGAEKAVITALFEDCDTGGELLLTREISSTGTSVARINGKTVTATDLKEAAAELIDIHGQHDSRMLTDNARQLELLDSFGGAELTALLAEYAEVFRSFSELSRRLKRMQTDESLKEEKAALLKDKIDDVNQYKLSLGEEAEVGRKLGVLRNAEAIGQSLGRARACLSADSVREASASLKAIAEYVPDGDELLKRLESLQIELDDIRGELGRFEADDYEPNEVRKLEERMSDLLHLKRKYRLGIDELIEQSEKWRDELAELEYSEDMTEKLIAERKTAGDNLKRLAEGITAKRQNAAEEMAAAITAELIDLDMPNVVIFFALSREKVTITGMDGAEIMISVNRGEAPKPLGKIASGGELSRVMLALKAILAEKDSTPTLIFDEIDTGISGRAAQKVGDKMVGLAEKAGKQVLCVTHLASIAAKADRHLLIEKSDDGARTFTQVTELNIDERKRELSRIISGDENELSIEKLLRIR
jgi:DNA repair protein RecN (Recombination protein N)